MAGYNTIRGLRIKYLSSDPTNTEEGQVWYNSVVGNLRLDGFVLSAFSSGGNRNDGQAGGMSAGTLTAGLAFGGGRNPNSPNSGGLATQTQSEEYNGSSWAEGGAMSQGRVDGGGTGTQTAALAWGGRATNNPFTYTNATEEYGGSSWTSGGNLGAAQYGMQRSGGGIQTAALSVGGFLLSPARNETEEYNGSSWTSVNDMITNTARGCYFGTQSSGLLINGQPPSSVQAGYNYDGTNWTANPASTNQALLARSGIGDNSAGLLMGGNPYAQNTSSELWNGSIWANDAVAAVIRSSSQSSCNSPVSAGYTTGGTNASTPGGALTSTEEYTATIATNLNITTG